MYGSTGSSQVDGNAAMRSRFTAGLSCSERVRKPACTRTEIQATLTDCLNQPSRASAILCGKRTVSAVWPRRHDIIMDLKPLHTAMTTCLHPRHQQPPS